MIYNICNGNVNIELQVSILSKISRMEPVLGRILGLEIR